MDVIDGIGCSVILCFIDQFGAILFCLDLYFLPLRPKKIFSRRGFVITVKSESEVVKLLSSS